MRALTRRRLLQHSLLLAMGALAAPVLGGCRERIIQIEKIVEVPKEVTKVVTEIVRETVIVERTLAASPSAQTPMANTSSATPAPKAPVKVVADVLSYGWTQLAMQMTPTFEEMFPHIKMEWRSASDWRDYLPRIASLLASDQLGDILETPVGVLPVYWAQRGVIQPLDELMRADGFDYRSIFEGAMEACLYRDQHIALPFLCHGGENVLLYNTYLFDRANVSYPSADWTLDDLQEAGKKLIQGNQRGIQGPLFGYAVRYDLPGGHPMLRLFDTHLFSPDGRSCGLSAPNTAACLGWARDQVLAHHLAPTPAEIERGTVEMFVEGRLGMLRHSLRVLNQLSTERSPTIPVGAVPFPRHPQTGKIAVFVSGMAYCIPSGSRVPSEVFQWIKFMSSREMGVQMFLGGYAEPGCRVVSWKDPRVIEIAPICASLADAMTVARPGRRPWNLRIAACMDAWNRGLIPLWKSEGKVDEIISQVTAEIDRILREPTEELMRIDRPRQP